MRKTKPKKRIILPDPKFNDVLVTQFINNLMHDNRMKNQELSPLDIWKKALENVTPAVEVKSRRVGGANFQVPMEIRPERKISISIKNLILYARKRSGKSMADKLASEIQAAFNEEGGAFKKKEETHRMAEANRAFAHFRF